VIAARSRRPGRWPRGVEPTLLNLACLLLAAFILAPFAWMLVSSLAGEAELTRRPPVFVPSPPTLANYAYIFTGKLPTDSARHGIFTWQTSNEVRLLLPALKNSFVVALSVMVVNVVFGALAAYSFARLAFYGRRSAYAFILGSRLLPAVAVAIPFYAIIQRLELLDTYRALIVVYLAFTFPFTIYFLSVYFRYLPAEVEEAALLDGCNRFETLLRVVVPCAVPGLVAAAAFAFMTSYNEFLFALLLTQTIGAQTMPVLLAAVATNPAVSHALLAACVMLAIVPPGLLALALRRYLTHGLMASLAR
jgi:multiple sugar transport system permease protein